MRTRLLAACLLAASVARADKGPALPNNGVDGGHIVRGGSRDDPRREFSQALDRLRPVMEAYQNDPSLRQEWLAAVAAESANMSAALQRMPFSPDLASTPQWAILRVVTDLVTKNTALTSAEDNARTMEAAVTLYNQGRHVLGQQGLPPPPAKTAPGTPPQTGAAPPLPENPPGNGVSPNASPGDIWAATPQGSAAMAEAAASAAKGPPGGSSAVKAGAQKAGGALSKAIGALKSMGSSASAGALGGGGGGAMGSFSPKGPAQGMTSFPKAAPARSGDPSRPAAPADLVAAVTSGYKSVAEEQGLRVGRGPDGAPAIVGADGRPATPEQLAALSARISGEPEALMRRPDFFGVIPRAAYDGLKDWIKRGSSRDAVKHMEVSQPDARDISWSRSCERVSGDCNPHAVESSYRKSEHVAPETLARAAEELFGAPGAASASGGAKTSEEAARPAPARPRGPNPRYVFVGIGSALLLLGFLLPRLKRARTGPTVTPTSL